MSWRVCVTALVLVIRRFGNGRLIAEASARASIENRVFFSWGVCGSSECAEWFRWKRPALSLSLSLSLSRPLPPRERFNRIYRVCTIVEHGTCCASCTYRWLLIIGGGMFFKGISFDRKFEVRGIVSASIDGTITFHGLQGNVVRIYRFPTERGE